MAFSSVRLCWDSEVFAVAPHQSGRDENSGLHKSPGINLPFLSSELALNM